jgi:helicase
MKSLKIAEESDDPSTNIALDTIRMGKQAIFFVNSKRAAESLSEKIAKKLKDADDCKDLAQNISETLPKPTRQCLRLSLVAKKGVAFHHAGLHSRQREMIENNFRTGQVKVICATPTLAFGLDLPAFRVVVRDVKRFGRTGMDFIPVLEYEQMAGRAGRPGKEDFGEAIAIAQSQGEKEKLIERYLKGKPEVIYSKLAVEPVLRTYILSLIASGFVHDTKGLMDFFERTFYAHQFKDLYELKRIIMKMLALLEEWEFIKREEEDQFRSADRLQENGLSATPLGRRVSELYLDPLSAHFIITSLRNSTAKMPGMFSFLFMIARCNEISPRLRVKMAEYDAINEKYVEREKFFLEDEPSEFSPDFEEFMDSFKTALFFEEWCDENDEEFLLEEFSIRPGEIHVKLSLADWLIYCTEELARMQGFHHLLTGLMKIRVRLQYGVKEELLPLLKLKNVGRVRARMMFKSNIKSLSDVRKADQKVLATILGPAIAGDVKRQVGEKEADPNRSLDGL